MKMVQRTSIINLIVVQNNQKTINTNGIIKGDILYRSNVKKNMHIIHSYTYKFCVSTSTNFVASNTQESNKRGF